MNSSHAPERVVIVGGGFAGLATAATLATAGLPVTLLEASQFGHAASTLNQGWLQSGAWFARGHPEFARICYASHRRTLDFCPECLEPGVDSMVYFHTSIDTGMSDWTQAWEQAGIPFEQLSRSELERSLPGVDPVQMQHGYRLPDRAFRPDRLLVRLAATARNAGAELRSNTPVVRLLERSGHVQGVVIGAGEELRARLVILATGAASAQEFSELYAHRTGNQANYELICLKTHLRAIRPETGCVPFCVVDREGLNHLPHQAASVFGSGRWSVVTKGSDQQVQPAEIAELAAEIEALFPALRKRTDLQINDWAGTTVQAMHIDQIAPGDVPLPTIIDHAQEPMHMENVLSIFPGRATLWAHLAEQVHRTVIERLGDRALQASRAPWQTD